MICFDTQILIWGVQGTSHPDQQPMVERTRRYIDKLEKDGERVMIPAPALAEYLAGFDPPEQDNQLSLLERCFVVYGFDAPAAALTARILAQRSIIQGILDPGLRRRALKVDAMIIAVALVHHASALITEDAYFRSLAAAAGHSSFQVRGVPDLPVQTNLFDQASES